MESSRSRRLAAPTVPDVAAMLEVGETALATVQGAAPPVEDPVAPEPQEPVG